MSRYDVRTLRPDDFDELMSLEESIFASDGEKTLGPYYVRVCCDLFSDSCFVCTVDDGEGPRIVAYLLAFVREREAWCTTLAVLPQFQGSRVVLRLLQAFVPQVAPRVDTCWFTVKADNQAARALHRALGAEETGTRKGFYGPGDERIVSRIDRGSLVRMAARYSRFGLIDADGARVTA